MRGIGEGEYLPVSNCRKDLQISSRAAQRLGEGDSIS